MGETRHADRGPKTIVFFPEGAYGPTNNCVGIGDVLRRRGHDAGRRRQADRRPRQPAWTELSPSSAARAASMSSTTKLNWAWSPQRPMKRCP